MGDRIGRGVQLAPTKFADKIPEGHTCLHCGRGLDKVNFSVIVRKNSYDVLNYCNFHSTPQKREAIKTRDEISEGFRDYFKEMR